MPDQEKTTPEVVEISGTEVSCVGAARQGNSGAAQGNASLGHPAVYLKLGAGGRVRCPYCDQEFILARSAGSAGSAGSGG